MTSIFQVVSSIRGHFLDCCSSKLIAPGLRLWVLELSCLSDRSIRLYGRACTHACIDRCLHHVVGSQIKLRFCRQSCSPTHTRARTLSIHLSLRQPPPLVLTDVTLSAPICVCTITVTEAWSVQLRLFLTAPTVVCWEIAGGRCHGHFIADENAD